jgi:hypothetical protein
MKKTCNGCRAINSYGCDLGYNTKITVQRFNGHEDIRKPLEECEKPKTYSEFIHLMETKRNNYTRNFYTRTK